MNITVVLCTYTECETLAKALRSVAMSKVPESLGWEVLVVDNNSDDQTWMWWMNTARNSLAAFVTYLSRSRANRMHSTAGY